MNKILEDSIPKKTTEKSNLAKKSQPAQDSPIKPGMTTPAAKKEDDNQARQAKIKKIQQHILSESSDSQPRLILDKIFSYLQTNAHHQLIEKKTREKKKEEIKKQEEDIQRKEKNEQQVKQNTDESKKDLKPYISTPTYESIKFQLPKEEEKIIEFGQTIHNLAELSRIFTDLNQLYRNSKEENNKNIIGETIKNIYHANPDENEFATEFSPNIFKSKILKINQLNQAPKEINNDFKIFNIPETTINKIPDIFGQLFYRNTDQIKDLDKYIKITTQNNHLEAPRFINHHFRKILRENNILPNQFDINQFYRMLTINPYIEDNLANIYPDESYDSFIKDYKKILSTIQNTEPETFNHISSASPITQEYTQTIKPEEPTEKPNIKELPKPWWKLWG